MKKKKWFPYPIIVALGWIFIFLLLDKLKVPNFFKIGVFVNIFFILLIVISSIYLQIKSEKKLQPFLINFKNGFKKAGVYIITVTAFLFFYFKMINPQFIEKRNQRFIELAEAKPFEELQKENEILKDITKEEFIENVKKSNEVWGSIKMFLSFYFLFLFFISGLFSVLVPIFYKKIVLRM